MMAGGDFAIKSMYLANSQALARGFATGALAKEKGALQAVAALEAGLREEGKKEEGLRFLLNAYAQAVALDHTDDIESLGLALAAEVSARSAKFDQLLSHRFGLMRFEEREVVAAKLAEALEVRNARRESVSLYMGGGRTLRERVVTVIEGLGQSLMKVTKNRIPFNSNLKTNVVFVIGQPPAIPSKDVETYVWQRIEDFIKTLPADENIVVLGHENIDPFGGELSARYGRDWNRKSIIARAVNRLGKERPHMMLALGPFLFVSNGQNHVLSKRKDPLPEEQDDAAFRLCSAIHQYPLSPSVNHYFVPAAGLESPNEAPVIPALDEQTMYINDAVDGVRRIIGSIDTGWIKNNVQESLSDWNSQNYSHFVLDLRPTKK